MAEHGGLAGKDILDFGCGEATAALGIALQYEPRRVVGVEIQQVELDRCLPHARDQLRLESLPENFSLHCVEPGMLPNRDDQFDLIYSWSVFEHIDQSLFPRMLDSLRSLLKPEGFLFIQVAPLYYSAEGSHMMPWVPEPWGHLLNQHDIYYSKLASAVRDPEQLRLLWSTYRTLNRITAPGLVTLVRQAGLEIVRDYRTKDEYVIPSELAEIFQPEILSTNQIVLLLRKGENSSVPR
ncbi:MAG TPA: class I SAM-dependent methyltransferase [Verrucomicrobiae bacterium]|nr:class I SAM-dependent methyltransferase [Verrucomicrobiae bacterium]